MRNKTIEAYCPKCDIYHKLNGIEKKVKFDYIGTYSGHRIMNDGKHNIEYLELMKYQMTRK